MGLFRSIDILKYIIYGLAAGFFVFGVLLLVEGFFTTGAIRDLYGEFKISACGRCLTAFVRNLSNQLTERCTYEWNNRATVLLLLEYLPFPCSHCVCYISWSPCDILIWISRRILPSCHGDIIHLKKTWSLTLNDNMNYVSSSTWKPMYEFMLHHYVMKWWRTRKLRSSTVR